MRIKEQPGINFSGKKILIKRTLVLETVKK